MSKCMSTAQARTKSAPRVLLALGLRHFTLCAFRPRKLAEGTFLEILNKIVILRCPNDFRRCRLQQNVMLISGARHFSCKFSQSMHLLRCPSAFRLRGLAKNARLIKWDLVQALVRSSCGDPDKVLSKRSLHDLVQVL